MNFSQRAATCLLLISLCPLSVADAGGTPRWCNEPSHPNYEPTHPRCTGDGPGAEVVVLGEPQGMILFATALVAASVRKGVLYVRNHVSVENKTRLLCVVLLAYCEK